MEEKGAKVVKVVKPEKPVVTVEEPKENGDLEKVIGCWNGVVDGLVVARDNWERMQKLLQEIPRDSIQLAPVQVQKATMRFRKASFNVMLGRLSDYYRAFGGLDAMRVKGAE